MEIDDDAIPSVPLTDAQRARFEAAAARALSEVRRRVHDVNPKAVGEVSEAMVLARLVQSGLVVLMPFGNNQRYDLVIDRGDRFERVQVKTGRLANGVVRFKCSSVNGFTGARTGYQDQADTFMIYCPENGAIYAVPVSDCGASSVSLRVDPAKGGPTSTLRLAADYLV